MKRIFTLTLVFFMLLSACSSPLKLLEKGHLEKAYQASKQRIDVCLHQQKLPSGDDLFALQESFRLLQKEQMEQLDELEIKGEPRRWLQLYPIYMNLLQRRREMESYSDLLLRFEPAYDLPSLEALAERSRIRAGAYCYEQALTYLAAARDNDKPAARNAYEWLNQGIAYVPENDDYHQLQAEMYDIGTVRVLIEISDLTNNYDQQCVSNNFMRRKSWKRKNWLEIYFQAPTQRIDYRLETSVSNIYVSNNMERYSYEHFSAEVIEGYDEVEKKIHQGDTLITVVEQIPRTVTVTADIQTIEQYKEAAAILEIELIPTDHRMEGRYDTFSAHVDWDNTYQICSGDVRALPHGCTGSCSFFPSDAELMADLGFSFQGSVLRWLYNYFPESRPVRRQRS